MCRKNVEGNMVLLNLGAREITTIGYAFMEFHAEPSGIPVEAFVIAKARSSCCEGGRVNIFQLTPRDFSSRTSCMSLCASAEQVQV